MTTLRLPFAPGPLALLLLLSACEGPAGPKGDPGADGSDGTDGADGSDGADGTDGSDGSDGTDGNNGQDGQSIGILTGHVYGDDGSALAGATVTTSPGTYTVTTDADGSYLFPGIPAGTFDLYAQADGWSDGTTSVTVQASLVTTADLTLSAFRADLPVSVTGSDGAALSGVGLTLRQWDWASSAWTDVATATTDASGTATFADLLDGFYVVRAAYESTDDYLPSENHSSAHPGETVSLVLNDNPYSARTQGSYYCTLCHDGDPAPDAAGWQGSLHALGLRVPGEVSGNQELTLWPGANAALDWFEPGNPHDDASGDDIGYTVALDGYELRLGHDDDGYFAQTASLGGVASERYDVVLTYGANGVWGTRFLVRLDEADWGAASRMASGVGHYLLPVMFVDGAAGTAADPSWVAVDEALWGAPSTPGGSGVAGLSRGDAFETACAGCHVGTFSISGDSTSGIDLTAPHDRGGELDFDGDNAPDSVNVGCEACHGPGGGHGTSPQGIVNPDHLTPAASNLVCARCHTRGESTEADSAGHRHAFAWNSAAGGMPHPGVDEALSTFLDEAPERWTDAEGAETVHSKAGWQQFADFQLSAHYDNPFERLTCATCHDVHQAGPGGQITQTLRLRRDGVDVELSGVSAEDNSLCLGCHAGHGDFAELADEDVVNLVEDGDDSVVAEVVTAHMDRQVGMGGIAWYDPSGSGVGNCVGCHMAATAKEGRWTVDTDGALLAGDLSDHSFVPVMPYETAATVAAGHPENIPNSCGSCHADYRYAP